MTKWLLTIAFTITAPLLLLIFLTEQEATAKAPSRIIKRVVSLAPSMTETMIALNQAHLLVGVTVYCKNSEVIGVPKIGSFAEPNFEAIMNAKPDLVLGVPHVMAKNVLNKIAENGILVFAHQPDQLSDIKSIVMSLARKFFVVDEGKNVNKKIDQAIKNAKNAFAKLIKQNQNEVLIVISTSPFVVAGKETFLSQIIEEMGLSNQTAKNTAWPVWPLEKLIKDPPAFIILTGGVETLPAFSLLMSSLGIDIEKSRIKLIIPDQPIFMSPSPAIIEDIDRITHLLAKS